MQPSSSLAYRPTWRGGRMADTISCSAAEFQILSLLETIKQQNDQLVAKVNLLTSRMNSTPGPDVEMPDSIRFPLEQLEAFEMFCKEPSNGPARQRLCSLGKGWTIFNRAILLAGKLGVGITTLVT
ncbi:unnamed protein product [Arctogadus glacialis]